MFDAWADTISPLHLLHMHTSTHTVFMSIIIHGQGHSVTIVGTKCLTRDVNNIIIMLFGPYTLTACNVTSFNTNYMVLYIFQ